MQNSIQFPYPFSSMIDFSSLAHYPHQNTIMANGGSATISPPKSPDSPGTISEAAAVAMSQFLFPRSFLQQHGQPNHYNFGHHHLSSNNTDILHGGGGGRGHFDDDALKECGKKGMKRGGGKSFTIDSLLGLSGAAARAIHRQSGLHHPSQHGNCLNLSTNNGNNNWNRHGTSDVGKGEVKKEVIRFHPFQSGGGGGGGGNHQKSHKNNSAINISSEKSPESGGSRRGSKAKRVRTIFTPEQLERLEAEFERQQYMVGPERLYLASSLHLTEAQVKVWFQNRRIKWRKQHLEIQQQRLAAIRSQQQADMDLEDEDEEDEEDTGSESGGQMSTPRSSPTGHLPPIAPTSIPLMGRGLTDEGFNPTTSPNIPQKLPHHSHHLNVSRISSPPLSSVISPSSSGSQTPPPYNAKNNSKEEEEYANYKSKENLGLQSREGQQTPAHQGEPTEWKKFLSDIEAD